MGLVKIYLAGTSPGYEGGWFSESLSWPPADPTIGTGEIPCGRPPPSPHEASAALSPEGPPRRDVRHAAANPLHQLLRGQAAPVTTSLSPRLRVLPTPPLPCLRYGLVSGTPRTDHTFLSFTEAYFVQRGYAPPPNPLPQNYPTKPSIALGLAFCSSFLQNYNHCHNSYLCKIIPLYFYCIMSPSFLFNISLIFRG